MNSCKHEVLCLMPAGNDKLRCRHCHLVITEEELGGSCCPECLEVHQVSRRNFEKIVPAEGGNVRYCCEGCGAIIEC